MRYFTARRHGAGGPTDVSSLQRDDLRQHRRTPREVPRNRHVWILSSVAFECLEVTFLFKTINKPLNETLSHFLEVFQTLLSSIFCISFTYVLIEKL